MEKWRENKKQYDADYRKKKIKSIQINFNREKEKDTIDFIEKKANVSAYIKSLIESDMKK